MTNEQRMAYILDHFDAHTDVLQKAIDRGFGDTTIPLLREDIENYNAQYWPVESGMIVTRILSYRSGVKALELWLAAGDLKPLHETLSNHLEDYAKKEGCSKIISYGARTGWKPVAESLGYKTGLSVFVKEI